MNKKLGRKPLPKGQKLVPVRVFVKECNYTKAKLLIDTLIKKHKL